MSKRNGRRRRSRDGLGGAGNATRWRMDASAGTALEDQWAAARERAEAQPSSVNRADGEPVEPADAPRVQLDAAPAAGATGAAPAAPAAPGGDPPRITLAAGSVEAAVQAERERVGGIYALLARDDAPEGATADRFIADGVSVADAERQLWNDRADLHANQDRAAAGRLGRVEQDPEGTAEGRMHRGMSDALVERAGSRIAMAVQTHERKESGDNSVRINGGEYRGMRSIDLCRVSLQAANGGRAVNADPFTMVEMMFRRAELMSGRALNEGDLSSEARVMQARRWAFSGGYELVGQQGRDQFSNALENAMHRVLHATYSGERSARFIWRRVCEIGSASDFRPHIHNFLGGLPDMQEAAESGQFPLVGLEDVEKGSLSVKSRGSEVRISRETIIDDNLGRVMRTMGHLAHSAQRTTENLWFAELAKQGHVGEFNGAAMFTEARGNLATGTAALTAASLYSAMVALETQKAVGDHDFAELEADTLIVHPTQYGLSKTILESPLEKTDTDSGQGGPNDHGVKGMIPNLLRSPRMSNAQRWVLLDSTAAPWMASFLFGRDAPYLQQVEPWSMRGTCYLGAIDVGVGPLTWRGAYLNKGTA